MFTLIVIMLWIVIIGTIIGGIIHIIRRVPSFLKDSGLKYKEEKWRKQKEKEYLESLEWLKITPDIYTSKANENPYRKEKYYFLPPSCREYWCKYASTPDNEYYTSKIEYSNPGVTNTISLSEFFFQNDSFIDPIIKGIIIFILILAIPFLLLISPVIILAKIYMFFHDCYVEKWKSPN